MGAGPHGSAPFLMAADYKRYRVRVMLECGHATTVRIEYPQRVPEEYIECGTCNCRVAVWAVECREWRSKCTMCTYTRWAGQSETAANEIARKHWVSKSHKSNVRYYINPETLAIIKKYAEWAGRRMRFRIEGVPDIKRPRKIVPIPDTPEF